MTARTHSIVLSDPVNISGKLRCRRFHQSNPTNPTAAIAITAAAMIHNGVEPEVWGLVTGTVMVYASVAFSSSVTVKVTLYSPSVANLCVGACSSEVLPSPKSQSQQSDLFSGSTELSVNWISMPV